MRWGRSYHGRPGTNIHTLLRNHTSGKLLTTIIQMRTGHGYNKHYLTRIPPSFFFIFYFIHTAGKPRAYGIIKENPATAQKYEKQRKSPTRSRSNYKHSLPPEYRNIKKLTNRDIYKSS